MAGALRGMVSRLGIMGELLVFLWERKLWWLIPMVSVLLLFGVLLLLAQSSAIAPFVYTLFLRRARFVFPGRCAAVSTIERGRGNGLEGCQKWVGGYVRLV